MSFYVPLRLYLQGFPEILWVTSPYFLICMLNFLYNHKIPDDEIWKKILLMYLDSNITIAYIHKINLLTFNINDR